MTAIPGDWLRTLSRECQVQRSQANCRALERSAEDSQHLLWPLQTLTKGRPATAAPAFGAVGLLRVFFVLLSRRYFEDPAEIRSSPVPKWDDSSDAFWRNEPIRETETILSSKGTSYADRYTLQIWALLEARNTGSVGVPGVGLPSVLGSSKPAASGDSVPSFPALLPSVSSWPATAYIELFPL